MKIYTRTGDHGKTSLVDNSRVAKNSLVIRVVGALDEANARLGSLAVSTRNKNILKQIKIAQSRLIDFGAQLANPRVSTQYSIPNLKKYILGLEESIDTLSTDLPTLTTFILPGGTESSSRAHLARSAVRFAEREIVALQQSGQPFDPLLLAYINRLSDWLFVVARWFNFDQNHHDELWQKGDNRRKK